MHQIGEYRQARRQFPSGSLTVAGQRPARFVAPGSRTVIAAGRPLIAQACTRIGVWELTELSTMNRPEYWCRSSRSMNIIQVLVVATKHDRHIVDSWRRVKPLSRGRASLDERLETGPAGAWPGIAQLPDFCSERRNADEQIAPSWVKGGIGTLCGRNLPRSAEVPSSWRYADLVASLGRVGGLARHRIYAIVAGRACPFSMLSHRSRFACSRGSSCDPLFPPGDMAPGPADAATAQVAGMAMHAGPGPAE